MSQTCPNCGLPVQSGHRFCSNCGRAITAGTSAPSATSPVLDATQPAIPVTYVVQRYEGAEQHGEVPGASEAPPQPEDPYRAFVPPSEPTASAYSTPDASPTIGAIPPPPPASRVFEIPQAGTGTSAYGNYAPPPSARAQGGAYAPYGSDAARPLEKPATQRSWLMPVVLASAAVLLLLALGGGYLLLNNKTNTTSGSIVSTLPANASEEDKVKEVVRLSNEEQIKAWRDLDPDVLKGTRIGQVLDENIQMVQMLKSRDMYAVPVNQSLEFVDVKVQGDNATVRTIETWTVTFFKKSDNTAIQKNGPDTLHETYFMVKQNGKWFVKQLQIDGQSGSPPPATTPTLPTT